MAFNIWTPQGQMAGLTARCNPNVIYEGNPQVLGGPNVFKMWCGVNNGGLGIYYYESADGLTSWTGAAGNPVIAAAATNSFPTVYKVGSTYYCYHGSYPGGAGIFVRTSSDGITWSAATLAIPIGSGVWDATGISQLNLVPPFTGPTYYGYYSGVGSNGGAGLLATSTDLINWTKGDVTNPPFTFAAQVTFQHIGSTYYAWGTHNAVSSQLFAQSAATKGFAALCRWSSSSPTGPWTLLTLPGQPGFGAGVIYPTIRADFDVSGTSSNTQGTYPADTCFVSALGNMYVYWTRSTNEVNNQYGINAAKAISCTPAQQVAGYEGMVNAPLPLFDGNLTVLGSDPGTGANANPIGGNWSHLIVGTDAQRASNLIESGAAAGNGIVYYNTPSFPADQWSEITVQNMISTANVGAFARMSTSLANTDYQAYWHGANIGSAGTLTLASTVAGAPQGPWGTFVGLKVSVGDTLRMVVSGTNIIVYYCGFPIVGNVDAGIASGAPGLWCNSASLVTDSQVSAWRGGGFQAAANAPSLGGNTGSGLGIGWGDNPNRCCSKMQP